MYHISTKYLGSNCEFIPRVPMFCATGEDVATKRICVAPSLAEALHGWSLNLKTRTAQDAFRMTGIAFIYSPDDRHMNLHKPSINEVPDIGLYEEFWLLTPTNMRLVGFLDLKYQNEDLGKLRFTRYESMSGVCKVAALAAIRKVLFYIKKYTPRVGFETVL
jgi:hypothetical protein